jgi:3-oxoadipate enol-lactonase
MHTEVIATPRIEFHCRIAGDPNHMPLLLVHGSYATSRWWEPVMRLLDDGFYIVAPDLRGCGETWRLQNQLSAGEPNQHTHDYKNDYEIESQAVDLAALVDALGWDEFDLMGHSSGGAIAMEFALANPERVHTLTLLDSAPIEGVFTPVDMLMLLEQMREDRELLRNALAALMPTYPTGLNASAEESADDSAIESQEPASDPPANDPPAHPAGPEFFEQLVEDATQMDPAAYTAVAEALNRWNRFTDADELTMPTLLIWGELDSVVDRDTTTRTLIAIPGANNLEVIRNVGHSPMLEAPVAVAERFIEFVTDDLDEYEQVRRDAFE